jgi:hypothetical protein
MVEETRAQTREFKRFKKLIDQWIELAIEQAKLSARRD